MTTWLATSRSAFWGAALLMLATTVAGQWPYSGEELVFRSGIQSSQSWGTRRQSAAARGMGTGVSRDADAVGGHRGHA